MTFAAAIGFPVEWLDAVARGATGIDGLYAPPLEPVTQEIGVVGLVGDQPPLRRQRFHIKDARDRPQSSTLGFPGWFLEDAA